jgi:hypothetical protein
MSDVSANKGMQEKTISLKQSDLRPDMTALAIQAQASASAREWW